MPSLQCWLYCSVLKEEQRGSCRLGHRVVMVFVTVFVFVSVYVFVFVFEHSAGGPCRVVQQAVMVVLVCRSAKVAPTPIVGEHLYRAAHTPSPPPSHCCPSSLDSSPTPVLNHLLLPLLVQLLVHPHVHLQVHHLTSPFLSFQPFPS